MTNPLNLTITYYHPSDISPIHQPTDEVKLATITESMNTHGWTGAPLVIDSRTNQAFTGAHRHAAATKADINIPTVELADLLVHYGADLAALELEYGDEPTYTWDSSGDTRIMEVIQYDCDDLIPSDILDAYGVDLG